ncbi:MAG: helix-turn-helix domain-containing protein [Roseicyclus sp.]|nr:helix-turn-helix domain-containing protein [Roseicyclus sp.]
MDPRRPERIGFLLFDGFPMACLTSMIEPMRAANEISKTEEFQWVLVSEGAAKVMASASVSFETPLSLSAQLPIDCLIVLSAPKVTFTCPHTPGHLRALARHGTVLGAVSGGVFPLVRSGVPRRGPISVHWCYEAAFKSEFPDVDYSDQVIEITPDLMTASGAAAAFDLSLQLIHTRLGASLATEVACWFQHPMMRGSDVRQAIPAISTAATTEQALPSRVSRTIEIYSGALSTPPTLAQVAADIGISTRQLERSFKQATGLNPTKYLRRMRMNAARQMVMYTNQPFSNIAETVGYSSAATLKRHYGEAFGLTPKEDRSRINLFRVSGNVPLPAT